MCESQVTETGGTVHTCDPSTGEDTKLEAGVGLQDKMLSKQTKMKAKPRVKEIRGWDH